MKKLLMVLTLVLVGAAVEVRANGVPGISGEYGGQCTGCWATKNADGYGRTLLRCNSCQIKGGRRNSNTPHIYINNTSLERIQANGLGNLISVPWYIK